MIVIYKDTFFKKKNKQIKKKLKKTEKKKTKTKNQSMKIAIISGKSIK